MNVTLSVVNDVLPLGSTSVYVVKSCVSNGQDCELDELKLLLDELNELELDELLLLELDELDRLLDELDRLLELEDELNELELELVDDDELELELKNISIP